MKNTKVTYLVDFFRTTNAGTERQLSHLLTHLPELGYSVQLISLQDSPFLTCEASRVFPNVRANSLGAKSDLSKSLPALARLFFLLRTTKPDIVHTFFPASNSFGILIARLAGVRVLISSRRDMGFNLTAKDFFFLKAANRFVSSVAVNSRAVQEQTLKLESISKEKTHVIYNGISAERFEYRPQKGGPRESVIGIVANLNRPVKRVDLFIQAAAMVHKNSPHVKFWIVGDGPLRASLERMASDEGLNSTIFFFGRRDDVHNLLRELTIGVLCSDSEGLSNTVMEYMQTGLPVIATNVGGNSELVEHGVSGFLVLPSDAQALAEAMRILLTNPKMVHRMGEAGRRVILRDFSINNMLRQTVNLYSSISSEV